MVAPVGQPAVDDPRPGSQNAHVPTSAVAESGEPEIDARSSRAGDGLRARRRHGRRIVLIAVGITALLVASYFIARPLQPYFESTYGIDPLAVLALFVATEVLFDLGLVIMLWFGGVRRLSWKAIRAFKLKTARVDWHHPGVMAGLLLNRLSWCVPFVYVIIAGWGRLPWFVTSLAAAEIVVTLWIGALAMGVVRGPRIRLGRGDALALAARKAGTVADEPAQSESRPTRVDVNGDLD